MYHVHIDQNMKVNQVESKRACMAREFDIVCEFICNEGDHSSNPDTLRGGTRQFCPQHNGQAPHTPFQAGGVVWSKSFTSFRRP